MKCKIQWIDKAGNPTPDDNEAVGMAVCHDPRIFGKEGCEPIPICNHHFKEMLSLQYWKMIPLPNVQEAIRQAFKNPDEIFSKMIYHSLDNYWSFNINGMFVGVEQDGHIHS
jgi:hypothetical protein